MRPAKLIALSLLLCACGTKPPSTGIVTSTLYAELSAEPGKPAIHRTISSIALLLERREHQGKTWSRILSADGFSGWTEKTIGTPGNTSVVQALPTFKLIAKSPDDEPVESAGEVSVQSGGTGTVLGATAKAYPATMDQLRLPPHLSSALPWLHLEFGKATGFGPVDWISFRSDPAIMTSAVGLLRRPFLTPQTPSTKLPRVGDSAVLIEQFGAQRTTVKLDEDWKEVETFYQDPSDESRRLSVFRYGAKRLISIEDRNGFTSRLLFAEHQPFLHRVESADLNGDGRVEWLFEMAFLYGDGAYSLLIHLPSSGVTVESLSHTGGEEGSKEITAGWGVYEGALWIARAEAKQTTMQKLGGKPSRAWLGVIAESAEPRTFATEGIVVPYSRDGRIVWITAVPFDSEAGARQWVEAHPGTRVIAI